MIDTNCASREHIPVADVSLVSSTTPPLGLVHGLPNDQYHRGPGLSNSGLKALRKSPWHYHALHHLPLPEWFVDDFDADVSNSLFAGTLCHCALLEPAEFDKRYLVGPQVKTRAAKLWKDFVEAHPKHTVITPRQYAVAHGQASALRAVPAVAEILDGGECEVSGYWKDPATGVLCRCRPDCMNRTFGTPSAPAVMLLDPKTTTDASAAAVKNTIARFGYHHQAEWYCRGIATITGLPIAGFIFAFVESSYPFGCRVVEIEPESYEVARRENREALELYAYCERMQNWPGYSPEIETVSLPRWAGGRGDY